MDFKEKFGIIKLDLVKILLMAIIFLFLGLIINFFLMLQFPRSRFYYLFEPSLSELSTDPLFVQFLKYIINFFSGNWGTSEMIVEGMIVLERMSHKLPRMVEIMVIPLIIGFILGKKFGKASIRTHNKWIRKSIKAFSSIGLIFPVFWFGFYKST